MCFFLFGYGVYYFIVLVGDGFVFFFTSLFIYIYKCLHGFEYVKDRWTCPNRGYCS